MHSPSCMGTAIHWGRGAGERRGKEGRREEGEVEREGGMEERE